jgi:hypothetical protein
MYFLIALSRCKTLQDGSRYERVEGDREALCFHALGKEPRGPQSHNPHTIEKSHEMKMRVDFFSHV